MDDMLDQTTLDKMIAAARQAMSRAHAPVSGFPVGAALLTASGEIFPGCNTESIIAGLGTCAERSAVDHAVIHGFKNFSAIMIVSTKSDPLYPCGACGSISLNSPNNTGATSWSIPWARMASWNHGRSVSSCPTVSAPRTNEVSTAKKLGFLHIAFFSLLPPRSCPQRI